jgi:hypothetical protein
MRSEAYKVSVCRGTDGRNLGYCVSFALREQLDYTLPTGFILPVDPDRQQMPELGLCWYAKRDNGQGNAFASFVDAVRWLTRPSVVVIAG